MKSLLIILTMLAVSIQPYTESTTINTTTNLSGKVTDAATGEAIIFATVVLYKEGKLIKGVETNIDGNYQFIDIPSDTYSVEASYVGYTKTRIDGVLVKDGQTNQLDLKISEGVLAEEICITEYRVPHIKMDNTTSGSTVTAADIRSLPTKDVNAITSTPTGAYDSNVQMRSRRGKDTQYYIDGVRISPPPATILDHHEKEYRTSESYSEIVENHFVSPRQEALSTFSIDVDRAAYSNVRRYIDMGRKPPIDAVRIEEMINYFDYDYSGPTGADPFAIHKSLVSCPWNDDHHIMHIALQGKRIDKDQLPATNLVFLIDVSGSMNSQNKLPLVKSSLKMLLDELREDDKVAIVVYAGAAGVVLPSTPVKDRKTIITAIEQLRSGGSTAGGAGIKLAYKMAKENYIDKGNNRVILATDGDFNVGTSSEEGLEKLIEKERKSGVFLSVLGFGMGNYKDSKMQILADKGNGNHGYIDNMQEARKLLVSEFAGTLYTIAKDVKIQVEFNPAYVSAYRLIGYENRMLQKEDFNNDKIDAGELGSGHTVTALYEIVPVGSDSPYIGQVDDLKYQKKEKIVGTENGELATIKLRYKKPDGDKSKKIVDTIKPSETDISQSAEHVRFAVSVAHFGLALRESEYLETYSIVDAISLAERSQSYDPEGYRAECIRLMKAAQHLDGKLLADRD